MKNILIFKKLVEKYFKKYIKKYNKFEYYKIYIWYMYAK